MIELSHVLLFCLEKNNQRKSNEIETDTDLKSVMEHFN